MNARRLVVVAMVLVGFGLQGLAYLVLAAPLGRPTDVSYSEPRMPYAALLFIVGVGIVFSSAIVYELLPDRRPDRGQDRTVSNQ
jgi:hypothetical protein